MFYKTAFQAVAFAIVLLDSTTTAVRTFHAAPKSNHLRRRDISFEPRLQGNTLFYAEESNGMSAQSAVRLSLSPKLPTLVHEDVHEHISEVRCDNSNISMKFQAEETMLKARDAWNTDSDFLFVTSEPGCAKLGEHAAYVVSFAAASLPAQSITLNAIGTTLRDSTHNIFVDLGRHLVSELATSRSRNVVRRGHKMAPPPPPPTTTTSYNWQVAPSPISQNITWNAPNTTSSESDVVADISFERIDTVLLPPGGDISPFLPAADIINNFELRCANCSLTGTLELEVAGFSLGSGVIDGITDFFDNGFFEFRARGVSGTFEFEFVVQEGFEVPVFEAQLPPIPLTPFAIPGLIEFGPVLELLFPIAITLDRDVTFTTGFTLDVPDESRVVLNVSDIASSFSAGFQDSVLSPIPFDTNVDDLSVTFTAGFRPQLLLNAGIGNDLLVEVSGGVGVFLDIPQLAATVTAVQNQNATCDGPAADGAENFGILFEAEATVAIGALWELEVSLGFLDFGREGEQELASISVPLASQCLLVGSGADSSNSSDMQTPTQMLQRRQYTSAATTFSIQNLAAAVAALGTGFLLLLG